MSYLPSRQEIAQTLWESQRARIKGQDGINARLTWRSTAAPDLFWHHYELDADAILALFAGKGTEEVRVEHPHQCS